MTATASPIPKIAKLGHFTAALGDLLDKTTETGSPQFLNQVGSLLAALIREDDWLPSSYAVPHPQYYQQYCLHRDPQ
ncbi:MAG: cysteine dioxygenase, partial [Betaproteobacteria bacterium]